MLRKARENLYEKDIPEEQAMPKDAAAITGPGQILYQIGEIESISGLNAQTIRRYDAKGILLGKRNDTNNYRYYDSIELCMAIWIRYLRNYDFSLSEVEEFMNEDIPRQLEMTKTLRERLEREQQLLDCRLSCLNDLRRALERFALNNEECFITSRPAMIGTFYRDRDTIIGDSGYSARISGWVDYTPIVQPMFRVGHDFIFDEAHPKTEYKIGLCLQQRYNAVVELEKDGHCVDMPEERCIHTVFEGYDALASSHEYLDRIKERVERFAKETGVVTKGPIYGSSFYSRRTEEGLHHLAHLWIPIGQ